MFLYLDESESESDDESKETGSVGGNVEIRGDNDPDGESIDASLGEVLKIHRANAKALKSPGAKCNRKVPAFRKRTPGAMPKMVMLILFVRFNVQVRPQGINR